MFFRLPILFKRKPVVKQPEKLDKFSEDGYKLDVAILTVLDVCKEYDEKGMYSMAREIHRQVGETILQRGLRRWQT
jgi:adenylylsulfate kinase-like enzyme